MTHRIRIAAALAAGLATVSVALPASAASERQNAACVTRGEFSNLDAGATRTQVERAWGVQGYSTWDRQHSDQGHDAYRYRRCGKQAHDARNDVRVTFTRHSRVWTAAELRAHGARVEVKTPIN